MLLLLFLLLCLLLMLKTLDQRCGYHRLQLGVQFVADPRAACRVDSAPAFQHVDLLADVPRAVGLPAEPSLFAATAPAPMPFVRGISPKDALSSLDTLYGNLGESCEV